MPEREPMVNELAKRQQVREERKEASQKRQQEEEDLKDLYKSLFSTPAGIVVYKDLMKHCLNDHDIFVISPDERANNYNQGKKSIANYINKNLEV